MELVHCFPLPFIFLHQLDLSYSVSGNYIHWLRHPYILFVNIIFLSHRKKDKGFDVIINLMKNRAFFGRNKRIDKGIQKNIYIYRAPQKEF